MTKIRLFIAAFVAAIMLAVSAAPAHAAYAYYENAAGTCASGHQVLANAWFNQNGYPGTTWSLWSPSSTPGSYYRFSDGSIDVQVNYWRGTFPSPIVGRAMEICHVVNNGSYYAIVNWKWPYLGGYVAGAIPWTPIY